MHTVNTSKMYLLKSYFLHLNIIVYISFAKFQRILCIKKVCLAKLMKYKIEERKGEV